jgi:hypothetical protein
MVRNHEVLAQSADFMIHDVAEYGVFRTIAKNIIDMGLTISPESKTFSYLSTGMKVCRVYGHDFCIGPKLSAEERASALCEIVAKKATGTNWNEFRDKYGAQHEDVARLLERKMRSGACGKFGELFK